MKLKDVLTGAKVALGRQLTAEQIANAGFNPGRVKSYGGEPVDFLFRTSEGFVRYEATFYHIDRNPISELAESLGLTGGRGSIQQGEYVETTYISKYDSNGNLITKIREIGDVEDGKGVHTHAWEFNPPGSFRGKLLKPNSFTYPDIVVEH